MRHEPVPIQLTAQVGLRKAALQVPNVVDPPFRASAANGPVYALLRVIPSPKKVPVPYLLFLFSNRLVYNSNAGFFFISWAPTCLRQDRSLPDNFDARSGMEAARLFCSPGSSSRS